MKSREVGFLGRVKNVTEKGIQGEGTGAHSCGSKEMGLTEWSECQLGMGSGVIWGRTFKGGQEV